MSVISAPAAPLAPGPDFDATQFRHALSQFATGVTVITALQDDGTFVGVTINSFNSVSLEPPLVLWSLAHKASSMAAFINTGNSDTAGTYVINVLSGDQMELAQRFARPGADRFDQLAFSLSRQGVPVFAGSVAWFECRHRSRYTEGDHDIFVGQVERCQAHPRPTLGFHRGRFIAL